MMAKRPESSVIILLGPVGAGKSTVGRLIQKELGGYFLSNEEFFIQKYGTYENYASHREQAYQALEKQIVARVEGGDVPLIFEEIAISEHGKHLVDAVSRRFPTNLICVEADLETCKSRVRGRGTAKNFGKSETVVEGAWTAFSNVKGFFKFKAEIRNQDISEQALAGQIGKIWS